MTDQNKLQEYSSGDEYDDIDMEAEQMKMQGNKMEVEAVSQKTVHNNENQKNNEVNNSFVVSTEGQSSSQNKMNSGQSKVRNVAKRRGQYQYFPSGIRMNGFRFNPMFLSQMQQGFPGNFPVSGPDDVTVSICILCKKQGLGYQRHNRSQCPVISLHKNSNGERICFKCKKPGHLVAQCTED